MRPLNFTADTRRQISLIVICVYAGGPVLAALGLVTGGLQMPDLKEMLSEWHRFFTPVAAAVFGYYFGSFDAVGSAGQAAEQDQ